MDRQRTVREHQAFRNLLQAFARPGTIAPLHPDGTDRAAALELWADSLLDAETSLGCLRESDLPVARALSRRTGCPLRDPEDADFALAGPGADLARLRAGDADYPDRGATALFLVEALRPEGGAWSWSGPGIPGTRAPLVRGLEATQWEALRALNAAYPLGIDAVFLDLTGNVMALPRSTRLEEVGP